MDVARDQDSGEYQDDDYARHSVLLEQLRYVDTHSTPIGHEGDARHKADITCLQT